ncbi:MAG: hypothetical protein C4337_06880 [Armatimonadota bacterium]
MFPAWSVVFGVAFGAAVGSFLNVLIYRLPRRLSIVSPPSQCPACQHRLGVWDLWPLLSYLFQRGRCRYCGAPISSRYFWVELWNALLWGWLWWEWLVVGELPLRFVFYALACSALIALFFTDIQYYLIPDELNVVILIIGLLHAGLLAGQPTPWGWSEWGQLNCANALLGAEIGALIFCAIAIIGRLVFRRDAMGHGDIKLVRAMGALALLPGMLTALGLAVVGGAVMGGVWALFQRRCPPEPTSLPKMPSLPAEPVPKLLVACLIYLLWLDVLIAFLPYRLQDALYQKLGLAYEEPEMEIWLEQTHEQPGMLPFGPFLALGTMAVILWGETFAQGIRRYLEWAGF